MYSAAGLRSNLFATQATIPLKKTSIISRFLTEDDINLFFRKLPSIQRVGQHTATMAVFLGLYVLSSNKKIYNIPILSI